MFLAAFATTVMIGQFYPCTRPRHYDGDAIACADVRWRRFARNHSMRLAAIDAPEIRCFGGRACNTAGGREARDTLRRLTSNQPVRCAWNGTWAPGLSGRRPVVDCAVPRGELGCLLVQTRHVEWMIKFDKNRLHRKRCAA